TNSLWVVPCPCSNSRGSPAHAVEFRGGSALPFECSPGANGPFAPPAGFCEGWQRIAVRAAFGRRFESRQHQFHNTAFSKGPGGSAGGLTARYVAERTRRIEIRTPANRQCALQEAVLRHRSSWAAQSNSNKWIKAFVC